METQSTRLLTPLTLARGQGTKPGHTELQVPQKLVSIQRCAGHQAGHVPQQDWPQAQISLEVVLLPTPPSKNGRALTSATPKLLPHKGMDGTPVAPSGWGMGVWMMGASGQQ